MAKEELEGLGTSVAKFLLDFDSDHARYLIHHCFAFSLTTHRLTDSVCTLLLLEMDHLWKKCPNDRNAQFTQRCMNAHDWVVHRAMKLADMIDESGNWLSATKMMSIKDSVGYVHSYFACNR